MSDALSRKFVNPTRLRDECHGFMVNLESDVAHILQLDTIQSVVYENRGANANYAC